MSNVVLTPHLAGLTATSMTRLSQGVVDTLFDLFKGKRPGNVVNPEVFER
jgi:D-3-phosphoglycerate dehydrogenase